MRREPQEATRHWLEREMRRRTVQKKRCHRCNVAIYIPEHLFAAHRFKPLCSSCASPAEAKRCEDAAAEWRRTHTLSQGIVDALEDDK